MKQPEKLLTFSSGAGWRAWLKKHHATESEAWLLHSKKGAARRTLSLAEGVEEALCFGWIDSLLRRVDDEQYALRYSPRKAGSTWSQINKRRVGSLIRMGRMTPAGLEKVAQAKASGEWAAAGARENVDVVPADLARELRRNKAAHASFTRWSASRKRTYFYWLTSAKRPATRQKRLKAIIDMSATGD